MVLVLVSVLPVAYEWWGTAHRASPRASQHKTGPQRRNPSSSAFVSTGRTSSPTSASGSPSGLRSIAQTTVSTIAPASRSARWRRARHRRW